MRPVALSVSGELKLQFEAAPRFNPEEKEVIRFVIESISLQQTMEESASGIPKNCG